MSRKKLSSLQSAVSRCGISYQIRWRRQVLMEPGLSRADREEVERELQLLESL